MYVSRFAAVALLVILDLLQVAALVYTQPKGMMPAGFVIHDNKIILEALIPEVTDADGLCQWMYADWWKDYEERREKARLGLHWRVSPEAWYWFADYTKYPSKTTDGAQATATATSLARPAVPVEAFSAENFALTPFRAGYRQAGWGCLQGCQDLRTTREWVIAIDLTEVRHVRARWTYGFMCAPNMVSVVYGGPTLREYETSEELAWALKFLATLTDPLMAVTDHMSIHGDRSPVLSKCKCVPKTPENFEKANKQISNRKGAPSIASKFYRQRPKGEAYVRSKTLRREMWKARSTAIAKAEPPKRRPDHTEAESSEGPRKRARSGSDGDDSFQQSELAAEDLGDITCYDFDYPDIEVRNPDLTESEHPGEDRGNPPINVAAETWNIIAGFDTWFASNMDSMSHTPGSSSGKHP